MIIIGRFLQCSVIRKEQFDICVQIFSIYNLSFLVYNRALSCGARQLKPGGEGPVCSPGSSRLIVLNCSK